MDSGRRVYSHPQFAANKFVISLKVWHQVSDSFAEKLRSRAAFDACNLAFPRYFQESKEGGDLDPPFDFHLVTTVIEASCSIYEIEVTDDDVSHLLSQAIDRIRDLQRANSYVSGQPKRLISFETLPINIPLATGTVSMDGFVANGGVSIYSIFDNISQIPTRIDLDQMQMSTMHSFLQRRDGFMAGYLASANEASVAAKFRGDNRAAVLSTATGCEIFLDDLLKHILWEVGRRPEECVQMSVENNTVTTVQYRTRRYMGELVGGNWNPDSQPALRRWILKVAHIRNRTIHVGHQPSRIEVQEAKKSAADLEQYAFDAIRKKVHRLPRTCLLLIGENAMCEERLLTRAVRNILKSEDPADWVAKFIRWRLCLERAIERQFDSITGDVSKAFVVAVIVSKSAFDIVLHDRESGLAARAQPVEDLPSGLRQRIVDVMQVVSEEMLPVSIAFQEPISATPLEEWVPEHRRLPLCEVMVDGTDFY